MTSTSTSLSTGKRVIADWGTSNLRVYLVDESGQVLERRESEQGILNVHDGAFAATLASLCSDWREAVNSAPILLAGMIGSRQGWVETPYAPCPTRLRDLAGLSARVTGPQDWPVQIAPGVSLRRTLTDTTAQHQADVIQADVMRGEEVQVFGAAELAGVQDGIFCLPGSHSKWVWLQQGAIVEFVTFLSGELYAALCQHTILGRLIPVRTAGQLPDDDDAFRRGLVVARCSPGILSAVFSARADCLLDLLPGDGVASYLSGLLIGAELAELGARLPPQAGVILIGSDHLAPRYALALQYYNLHSQRISAQDASIAGLLALNRTETAP